MNEISVAINENGRLYYTEQFVKKISQQSIEKDKEIDRLNNIINELEKVFIECDYQHLQKKLKALKEDNK